jgi:hypothetical protein
MQDIPLDAVLAFWEDNPLTVTPEAYVADMLAQVEARQ